MANRFKDPMMRRCYEAAMTQAADNFSDYYYGTGKDGPRWPHRGAGNRCAFWDGYNGKKTMYSGPGTLGYAFYRAGQDFRRMVG